LRLEVDREPVQPVNFSGREEKLRDFGVIGQRPDVFEIDTDLGVGGDGDEGTAGRVR